MKLHREGLLILDEEQHLILDGRRRHPVSVFEVFEPNPHPSGEFVDEVLRCYRGYPVLEKAVANIMREWYPHTETQDWEAEAFACFVGDQLEHALAEIKEIENASNAETG